MSENHWATLHNCRVGESGERVADVRALCRDAAATCFVFRPEQITCSACAERRARLVAEIAEEQGWTT